MEREHDVAGVSCSQVLARLSEYLDGELERGDREQMEAHLRGCDWCERFGGDFAAAVRALRRRLSEPIALDSEVQRRLEERMQREFEGR